MNRPFWFGFFCPGGAFPCFRCYAWHMDDLGNPPDPKDWDDLLKREGQ